MCSLFIKKQRLGHKVAVYLGIKTQENVMHPEDKNQQNENENIPQSNAAKRLMLQGAMEEDASPIVVEKESFLSNFWYHHKWKVIIISAFAFIFLSVGTQFLSKSNPDIKMLYAGPLYFTPNQSQGVSLCLQDLMEDYNGDGEKKIAITDMVYMTAQQMLDAQAEAEATGEEFAVDRQSNAQTAEQFTYEIMAGDSWLCFFAPDQYASVADAQAFVPLTEIFGEVPEGAVDECGIRISETKFYKYYTAMQIFGEDTVVALRKLTTFNKMKGEEKMRAVHGHHKELFYKMGTFEYPEGYTPPEETEAAG